MTGGTAVLTDSWTRVNGVRMYARVSLAAPVDAPAIVLLHGYGVSSRYMVPLAEELARTHPVLAPDLPGWGRSDNPKNPMMIPELAHTLADWLDAVGIERAVILGNSMGCQFIAALALQQPARIERAVLVSPTIDRHARSVPRHIWRLALDIPREHPAEILITARDYLRFGPRRGWFAAREMFRYRIEDELPHITAPALVVRGERDPIVPQRWAEEVARLLPNGQLVVIPGAPHALNFSHPRQLAQVVRAFLDAPPPKRRGAIGAA